MNSGRPIMLRGAGDEYDLRTVLGHLKDSGCSILVSGDVPVTTSQMVSQRLFGHPDERRLRTLLDHVDAMITVRKDVPNEPPMQKWTVPGFGESPWVPLRGFD